MPQLLEKLNETSVPLMDDYLKIDNMDDYKSLKVSYNSILLSQMSVFMYSIVEWFTPITGYEAGNKTDDFDPTSDRIYLMDVCELCVQTGSF